ncbi:MAG TPA: tRNA pseudouridine(38-40) synthase TruA [Steroidobacteraceae bacterium]|jgi:tRNA pseudouridine38-40 synthase|nr:tRNA pseudouridine(38-40) synthase TruA [Steroidobacteraceae bacterium]
MGRRIALGVSYDGGRYSGWQQQSSASSIQATLERALGSIADERVELICAGRTDAGVHACRQVVHFDTQAVRPSSAWLLGSNKELPPDISVSWSCPVPDHFHARYSALLRTYRYVILNRSARSALTGGRALVFHHPLQVEAMRAGAQWLIGEHDFDAFRSSHCQSRSSVRRLDGLEVNRRGDWVTIEVSANAFLHHMVRNIVGLLVTIGQGRAPPERAREQLESRRRSTGAATAAAHGLYLWQVQYPPQFGLPADSAIIGVPGEDA